MKTSAAGRIAAAGNVPVGGIKYLVVGKGPLGKDLKAAVSSRGLADSFIFTGFMGDVRPLLTAADIFVLPSYREGFPVSVLEALAAGKPVQASDIAGVNEAVTTAENGLLFPAGDSAAFAAGLGTLRAVVTERFGLGKMMKAHEGLYGGTCKRMTGIFKRVLFLNITNQRCAFNAFQVRRNIPPGV